MSDDRSGVKQTMVSESKSDLVPAKPKGLVEAMQAAHPINGVFGEVFEELGGADMLAQWAKENYSQFIKIFSRMAPTATPENHTSQINIQVNAQLGPSPLDE